MSTVMNVLIAITIFSFILSNGSAVYLAYKFHSLLILIPIAIADISSLISLVSLSLLKQGFIRRQARPTGISAQLFKNLVDRSPPT